MPAAPSDPTVRSTDLNFLHPVFREKLQAVLKDLAAAKIPLFVFEAFRGPERQAYLYAQGRTRKGPIVTYARPWRSFHQYGLAVDLVFGGPGKWTWNEPRRGAWEKMHKIGHAHGLMPLDFETPHLQLAGYTSEALYAGAYPPGGDPAWTDNLNAVIARWKDTPASPPRVKGQTRTRSFAANAPKATKALALDHRATPHSPIDTVALIAANSEIARYRWRDRGRAPLGYIQGMAITFARLHAKLKQNDPFAKEMARADKGDPSDALAWYQDIFQANGMSNSSPGPETLRHLFVLLIGLGMRESSGRYCEGRDRSATNTTAETAEAGLLQMSYNSRKSSPLLPRLFENYRTTPSDGFIDVFKIGVTARPGELKNHGKGMGVEFQALCKSCPAFAVEYAAVAFRNNRKHWGPITRREAEIKQSCNQMLKDVQAAVDRDPAAYAAM